jgi:flagellar motor switch protein FliN
MMSESANAAVLKKLGDLWGSSFAGLLTSLQVVSPAVSISGPVSAPGPTAQEIEKLVCIRFSLGKALNGELLWVAEKPAALALAQLFMSEALNPAEEFGEEKRDAFSELLRQVAGNVATGWKGEFGTEIELSYQATVEPAPVTAKLLTMRLTAEKIPELTLRLFLNEELANALASMPASVPAPAEVKDEKPKPALAATPEPELQAEPEPPAASRTTPLPTNLGLVLDVELEATIRFGEREMLLRDIFGLIAGAVVELNQMVNEPAQLLVAGRLVARGEVVVVDGNFGLRVTEVASVNERVAAIPL